jgi:hypothetical protein
MLLLNEIAAAIKTTVNEHELIVLMQKQDRSLSEAQCREVISIVRLELAARMQKKLPGRPFDW